jgi:hypothetical protein
MGMLQWEGKYITYLTSVENQHLSHNNPANSRLFSFFPQKKYPETIEMHIKMPNEPHYAVSSKVKAEALTKCSSDVGGG